LLAARRAKRNGLRMNLPAELIIHVTSELNEGIFVPTRREQKFDVAWVDSDQICQVW